MTIVPFEDMPPEGNVLTSYDLAHLALYIELLDAAKAPDPSWQRITAVLFGIDAVAEPDRALRVYASHLARARWMTEVGYRQLAAMEAPRRDSPDDT
ncbi:DUF2285 domain-containing protein [Novosphingobium sp.]|uniref:DUF2285 domain-containing protein n=1 Tax=Novosphingobium sp. TaxID=1874826 RepID=UPI0026050C42|nr:DUF2285 domain-containing protein [Novosphingobium sp.]